MLSDAILQRIQLLTQLQTFISSENDIVIEAKQHAQEANGWFTQSNINLAIESICDQFLDEHKLKSWLNHYPNLSKAASPSSKTLGIVMAGNIPLVGFHDFLCGFIAGYNLKLKLSSKDQMLWKTILGFISSIDSSNQRIESAEMLTGCDLYLATGSNNTSRYFEEYFGKYPSIIRKNRTSVAVLDGNETMEELEGLKEDCTQYFGLGCRNVTKIYVPTNYDFSNLVKLFDADEQLSFHTKYQNNLDYHLAIYLLSKVEFVQGKNVLFVASRSPFAPTGTVHYEFYGPDSSAALIEGLEHDDNIQAIVCRDASTEKSVEFGKSQRPSLMHYADGVDTLSFLEKNI